MKNKILFSIATILILSILSYYLFTEFNTTYSQSYTTNNLCFLDGNMFLSKVDKNSVIITDESTITYYYAKRETHFYPNPWDLSSLKNLIDDNYKGKKAYILFSGYDMPLDTENNLDKKSDLENNFKRVFECGNGTEFTYVYEYSS
jgi:hypothetical protein